MNYIDAVTNHQGQETTRTANGMKEFKTSKSAVLDLFQSIGSCRGNPPVELFSRAYQEDVDLTTRLLLWLRDIREGSGERQLFKDLLNLLESFDANLAGKLIHKIPELGRYDDLLAYENPNNYKKALDKFSAAIKAGDGLACKWAPREKSSKKKHARKLMKHMNLKSKDYRQLIVKGTDVVENKMCANQWTDINYEHVPSIAALRYQQAFRRHDPEGYSEYADKVTSGEAKINTSAVYPYQIVKDLDMLEPAVANAQWESLPDFVGDSKVLPIVDVSGSMTWTNIGNGLLPIHVAISLGLYTASKNKSVFKDLFMTFSHKPEFVKIQGNSLLAKVRGMSQAEWGGDTDLEASMELLLKVAVDNNVKEEDLPDTLLIITDMEFNQCSRYDDNALDMIARKFFEAGYGMPKVIFWNVGFVPRSGTPVQRDMKHMHTVSGFNPKILDFLLQSDLTAYDLMIEILTQSRYDYDK